jgi:hypothetical protein
MRRDQDGYLFYEKRLDRMINTEYHHLRSSSSPVLNGRKLTQTMIIEAAAAATTKGSPRPAEVATSRREFRRSRQPQAACRQPGAGGRGLQAEPRYSGLAGGRFAPRRRAPRNPNVTRPKFGAKSTAPRRAASPASSAPAAPAAKTGTDDWEAF